MGKEWVWSLVNSVLAAALFTAFILAFLSALDKAAEIQATYLSQEQRAEIVGRWGVDK